MPVTANDLIKRVCQRCFWNVDGSGLPTADAPLASADILAIADEEIVGELMPQVLMAQGDYYLQSKDYAITRNQKRYRLPSDLYGPIRDVLWIEDTTDPQQYGFSVPQLNIEELGRTNRIRSTTSKSGFYFYVDGDTFGLWPNPDQTTLGTMRVRYYRAPNKLALLADCTTVNSFVDGGTYLQITAAANPNATTWNVGAYLDVISYGNAHALRADNLLITVRSGGGNNIFTVVSTYSDTGYGEVDWTQPYLYLALHGYTPLVQLPDHMIPQAVRRIAGACLRAAGDTVAAEREEVAAMRLAERSESIEERSEAEPHIIVPRNSPIRSSRAWR